MRYPDAHCELDFTSPFELLVATVLSAQTTDVRVNLTTPVLFARYPDAAALSAANPEDVEEILRPTGFFRAKTKSVMGLSAALVERFGGEVPPRLKDLVTLPGVGRKTANVVLGNAFGIPGITTDTHVMRLSQRLGYTDERRSAGRGEGAGPAAAPGRLDHGVAPADLPRPSHVLRPQARVRRVPDRVVVPVGGDRGTRPGQGRGDAQGVTEPGGRTQPGPGAAMLEGQPTGATSRSQPSSSSLTWSGASSGR